MMRTDHKRTGAMLGWLLMLCVGLVACSSGGDNGGGGGGTAAATVSGTVSSPGGLLAKVEPTKLQRFFASLSPSEAWAQVIGGFAPVPNANVFLIRITNAGVPTGVPLILAQTTTNAAGLYTITLPAGVTYSSDLIIQVTNAATPQPIPTAGTQNAPATQATVNVNPISEEVLREVIVFLGANPARSLADFSAAELSDLQRIISAALTANPSLVGATAAQTIANIQAALAAQFNQAIPQMASGTRYLIVFSTALPNGQVSVPYSQPILAIGAPGPLAYQVSVGALPAGVTLNAGTGQLTGTPTSAGTSPFTIQVSVATPPPSPVTQALSITVTTAPPGSVVGVLERISLSSAPANTEGNGESGSISFNVQPAPSPFVLTKDRHPVGISADGRYVAFTSAASNLVANDGNNLSDIFLRDRTTGTTTLVSKNSAGAFSNGASVQVAMSSDPLPCIAFMSNGTNLDPLDTAATPDVFRHCVTTANGSTGTTALMYGTPGLFASTSDLDKLAISRDGRYVAWVGLFALVGGEIRDAQETRHRHIDSPDLVPVLVPTVFPAAADFVMNATATSAAFTTAYPFTAGDDNCATDAYVAEMVFQPANLPSRPLPFVTLTNLTRITNAPNVCATGGSILAEVSSLAINSSGRFVVYATNLQEGLAGDTNTAFDLHLYDRLTATKELVSARDNTTLASATGGGISPSISDDGNLIAFTGPDNLVTGGAGSRFNQVLVRNRATQRTLLISQTPAGLQGNGNSHDGVISSDGRFVAFSADANNLVTGDANNRTDVFIACTGFGACP